VKGVTGVEGEGKRWWDDEVGLGLLMLIMIPGLFIPLLDNGLM
jgi:hypothetical protein